MQKQSQYVLLRMEGSRSLVISNILIIYIGEIQDVQGTGTWENWGGFHTYRH